MAEQTSLINQQNTFYIERKTLSAGTNCIKPYNLGYEETTRKATDEGKEQYCIVTRVNSNRPRTAYTGKRASSLRTQANNNQTFRVVYGQKGRTMLFTCHFKDQKKKESVVMRVPYYKSVEDLYDENLKLKSSLNESEKERRSLKTQIMRLEEEIRRHDKQYEDLVSATMNVKGAESLRREENQTIPLRRMVRSQEQTIKSLQQDLQRIQNSIRYSRLAELEAERRQHIHEITQLNQQVTVLRETQEYSKSKDLVSEARNKLAYANNYVNELLEMNKTLNENSKKLEYRYKEVTSELHAWKSNLAEKEKSIRQLEKKLRESHEQAREQSKGFKVNQLKLEVQIEEKISGGFQEQNITLEKQVVARNRELSETDFSDSEKPAVRNRPQSAKPKYNPDPALNMDMEEDVTFSAEIHDETVHTAKVAKENSSKTEKIENTQKQQTKSKEKLTGEEEKYDLEEFEDIEEVKRSVTSKPQNQEETKEKKSKSGSFRALFFRSKDSNTEKDSSQPKLNNEQQESNNSQLKENESNQTNKVNDSEEDGYYSEEFEEAVPDTTNTAATTSNQQYSNSNNSNLIQSKNEASDRINSQEIKEEIQESKLSNQNLNKSKSKSVSLADEITSKSNLSKAKSKSTTMKQQEQVAVLQAEQAQNEITEKSKSKLITFSDQNVSELNPKKAKSKSATLREENVDNVAVENTQKPEEIKSIDNQSSSKINMTKAKSKSVTLRSPEESVEITQKSEGIKSVDDQNSSKMNLSKAKSKSATLRSAEQNVEILAENIQKLVEIKSVDNQNSSKMNLSKAKSKSATLRDDNVENVAVENNQKREEIKSSDNQSSPSNLTKSKSKSVTLQQQDEVKTTEAGEPNHIEEENLVKSKSKPVTLNNQNTSSKTNLTKSKSKSATLQKHDDNLVKIQAEQPQENILKSKSKSIPLDEQRSSSATKSVQQEQAIEPDTIDIPNEDFEEKIEVNIQIQEINNLESKSNQKLNQDFTEQVQNENLMKSKSKSITLNNENSSKKILTKAKSKSVTVNQPEESTTTEILEDIKREHEILEPEENIQVDSKTNFKDFAEEQKEGNQTELETETRKNQELVHDNSLGKENEDKNDQKFVDHRDTNDISPKEGVNQEEPLSPQNDFDQIINSQEAIKSSQSNLIKVKTKSLMGSLFSRLSPTRSKGNLDKANDNEQKADEQVEIKVQDNSNPDNASLTGAHELKSQDYVQLADVKVKNLIDKVVSNEVEAENQ